MNDVMYYLLSVREAQQYVLPSLSTHYLLSVSQREAQQHVLSCWSIQL